MSIYYNKITERYVVRSYRDGAYTYIGQYVNEADAIATEERWRADMANQSRNETKHTAEWFALMSKRQAKELPVQYPRYRNGKPYPPKEV